MDVTTYGHWCVDSDYVGLSSEHLDRLIAEYRDLLQSGKLASAESANQLLDVGAADIL